MTDSYLLWLRERGTGTDARDEWPDFVHICRSEYQVSAAEFLRRVVVQVVKDYGRGNDEN